MSPCATLSEESCSNRLSAFRVENSSKNGFDLLWAGSNASNVPKGAMIRGHIDSGIVLYGGSSWRTVSDAPQYFGMGMAYTNQKDAWLSFAFDGVAIWYDCVPYT